MQDSFRRRLNRKSLAEKGARLRAQGAASRRLFEKEALTIMSSRSDTSASTEIPAKTAMEMTRETESSRPGWRIYFHPDLRSPARLERRPAPSRVLYKRCCLNHSWPASAWSAPRTQKSPWRRLHSTLTEPETSLGLEPGFSPKSKKAGGLTSSEEQAQQPCIPKACSRYSIETEGAVSWSALIARCNFRQARKDMLSCESCLFCQGVSW